MNEFMVNSFKIAAFTTALTLVTNAYLIYDCV